VERDCSLAVESSDVSGVTIHQVTDLAAGPVHRAPAARERVQDDFTVRGEEHEVFAGMAVAVGEQLHTRRGFPDVRGPSGVGVPTPRRDEVFNGTTLLNPDGTVRWSIYRLHPDIVSVKRMLPGGKDRQVFFAVESNIHAGAYLVDARSGKIIWKVNREDDAVVVRVRSSDSWNKPLHPRDSSAKDVRRGRWRTHFALRSSPGHARCCLAEPRSHRHMTSV
jgi:hypothetical protein